MGLRVVKYFIRLCLIFPYLYYVFVFVTDL